MHSKTFANGREVPAQSMDNFLKDTHGMGHKITSSCPSKLVEASLHELFPSFVTEHLKDALFDFQNKLPGFICKDALLLAPETRTSSPVTILRDRETLEGVNLKGLFPCGEGAGHAGGITSAAVDGVRVSEAIISYFL